MGPTIDCSSFCPLVRLVFKPLQLGGRTTAVSPLGSKGVGHVEGGRYKRHTHGRASTTDLIEHP